MVTARESMTFICDPKNIIASEHIQIQLSFSYLDLAKGNYDNNPTAAWVCTRYQYVAPTVKPVPWLNGSIPDASVNWKERVPTQA
jgi:hypothetical protein